MGSNKPSYDVGTIIETKSDGPCEVIEYHGCWKILVRFPTGYETWTTYQKINKKTLKDKSVVKPTVYGVGINDADYVTQPYGPDGKRTICPFYRCWKNLLLRCYTDRDPTYHDCTVSEEWFYFSTFKSWMEIQDWKGKELDKDLLVKGNRIYSPETCLFVTHEVNCFILHEDAPRGPWPLGVHYNQPIEKFVAAIGVGNGKRKHLGCFETPEEASDFYLATKKQMALDLADRQTCERTSEALRKRFA